MHKFVNMHTQTLSDLATPAFKMFTVFFFISPEHCKTVCQCTVLKLTPTVSHNVDTPLFNLIWYTQIMTSRKMCTNSKWHFCIHISLLYVSCS